MKESHPVIHHTILDDILEPQRMVFIVNPKAGTNMQKRIRSSIDSQLNHRKFEYGIWHTEYEGHATELARRAVAEGYEFVVAVGGDGSVNEVAAGLLHTGAVLGIVPAGSGNGLATHLGYDRNIDESVRKLNTATVKTIDCGALNDRLFINVAGIGFDGLVSNMMKGRSKRGLISYFFESVKAGLTYEAQPCVIECNGLVREEKCLAISVANGPMYGYNVQIAPDARIDDGLFSVVLLKDAPRWQYFAAVPSTLSGHIFEAPFVEHFSTASLTVRCSNENFVHLDGEGLTMQGELKFEIKHRALKILVPRTYEAGTPGIESL